MKTKQSKKQQYSFKMLFLMLLVFVSFGFANNSYAQNQVVSGNVSDASGMSLPGATITIKGNETLGTQTDFDGNYSIEVPNAQTTLVFRYLGYVTQEVLVGTQSVINVKLQEDAESLDEIVLVGYGTQRKAEVTAAITSVDVAKLQKIPTADIATSLQGQVAGVNVAVASGAPGSDPVIRIRGLGTIGNNNPLYVININADNNSIIVGEKDYLEIKKIKLRELNILGSKKEFNDLINIKVRSTGRLLKAKINIKDNLADVEILDKETGISPGQACVFYSKDDVGDKVLGGGWIHKTFNKNLST